jgi:hypothetical protein
MPRLKRHEAKGSDKIILEWDRPLKENGIITHYMVIWNAKSIGSVNQDPCGSNLKISSDLLSDEKSEEGDDDEDESVDTCPAQKGCCKCNDVKASNVKDKVEAPVGDINPEDEDEKAKFENAVQNIVPQSGSKGGAVEKTTKPKSSKSRFIRSITNAKQPTKNTEVYDDNDSEELDSFPTIYNSNITAGRINVTSTRLVIAGLTHYTEYHVQIVACQDVTAPENYCSKQASSRFIRTDPILENDIVDLNTIEVGRYIANGTDHEDSRVINWKIPDEPNGALLGFRFKIYRETDQSVSHTNLVKINVNNSF